MIEDRSRDTTGVQNNERKKRAMINVKKVKVWMFVLTVCM